MKTVRQILAEGKTVSYAAHDDFGSPAKKVLARKSPSSSGGEMEEEYGKTWMKIASKVGLLPKDKETQPKKDKTWSKDDVKKYSDNHIQKDWKTRKEETSLEEGNPLATMHKHQEEGRHFIALSTERPGLSKKEVKVRNAALVASARAEGFGVRKAEGRYEGGKETSHIIHAKAPGREAGAELVAFGRKMGQKFDQDSVLHHNGKTARLIGTNETGFPGKGNSEKVGGKLKYNNPESPFQTELRPSKKKAPARFTT